MEKSGPMPGQERSRLPGIASLWLAATLLNRCKIIDIIFLGTRNEEITYQIKIKPLAPREALNEIGESP